ncbi:hypothetical protein HK102_006049 [Quaeritorhiza haematococci]|nr:hypothetical protein HK102_006049 [Quaeritorhiza haematococci]
MPSTAANSTTTPVPLSQLIFHKYDTDHSHTLTPTEFHSLAFELGYYLTPTELTSALASLDKDSDGTINLREFQKFWSSDNRFARLQLKGAKDAEGVQRASKYFQYFDVNGSGRLDGEEFEKMYENVRKEWSGFLPQGVTAGEALKVLDRNGNGGVDFNEYIAWLQDVGSLKKP